MAYERLSPQDCSFLYMEQPAVPMHVGSVAVIEDPGLDLEEICEHIDRRLALVPRFRRKLMWVPYHQGRPVWVDDAHFDVRYHVRHAGLPHPAGERELLTTAARILSTHLDRKRPLWEIWVLDLPDNRKALLQKTHHSLIDGISGVDVATVLLDLTPDAPPTEKSAWEPVPAPTKTDLLRQTLLERAAEPAEILRTFRAATRRPRQALQNAIETGRSIVAFGRSGLAAAPHTSLNVPIGAFRRFEVVRSDLDAVKAVKRQYGCTVNDVVLAIVTAGLRAILTSRGDDVTDLSMRTLVPMSVRPDSERMTLGNKVSGMFAHLPVGEPDPRERLRLIHEELTELKNSNDVVGADAIMRAADFAPPTLLSLAGRAMAGTSTINLTVTNVPGPQFPLYFRGARMLEAFPYVPLVDKTDVGVAVLSYDGQLNFGITGDWDTVPDLGIMAEGIEKALAELQ